MRTPRISGRKPKSKIIIMTGGVNQSISNLELTPGELFEAVNYEEIDGTHYGYRSTDGYERVDSLVVPSETPFVIDYDTDPITIDDTARVAIRLTVNEIPGDGDTLGTFEKGGVEYVLRDDGGTLKLYSVSGVAGFTEISSFSALSIPASGMCHTYVGRFAEYDSNNTVAVICTGTTEAVMFDSTGCSFISDTELPSDPYFPQRSIKFNERLFLAFEDGNLYFGGQGATGLLDFDPVTALAGAYFLEDEITNLITAPNSLVCFCDDSIHLITKTDYNIVTGIDMAKEVFNDQEGAYADTAQKVMGRIIYASREGITTLDTTANFGDFEQFAISKNVQRTFDSIKNDITGSSVVKDKSQYRLYFSDGTIIAVTFDVEKGVKGATILKYPIPVSQIWEERDNVAYFVSQEEAYLYRRSVEAVAFDGDEITTALKTAYYHYDTPDNNKSFSRLLTELDADNGVTIKIRPVFDYAEAITARVQAEDIITGAAAWNEGALWGTTTNTVQWAAPQGAVQRVYTHLHGIGTNMSLVYSSLMNHFEPHTIHNCIVNYKLGANIY